MSATANGTLSGSLTEKRVDPRAHEWVHDAFEVASRGLVLKNDVAKSRAIERPVECEDVVAEALDHRREPFAARRDRLAREHVCVDHGNTGVPHARDDIALARSDPTSQSNAPHVGSGRIVGADL